MSRPPTPLGTFGKIATVLEGSVYVSRTRFRDLDGIVRPVKRSGKSAAAAERALKKALIERQAPAKDAELSPGSTFAKAVELWLAEYRKLVDAGQRSPGTFGNYVSVYENHVRPALGALRLREVTTPVVDRLLSSIGGKSSNQAQVAKVVVSGVMRHAARHGAVQVTRFARSARFPAHLASGLARSTPRNASNGCPRWKALSEREFGTFQI